MLIPEAPSTGATSIKTVCSELGTLFEAMQAWAKISGDQKSIKTAHDLAFVTLTVSHYINVGKFQIAHDIVMDLNYGHRLVLMKRVGGLFQYIFGHSPAFDRVAASDDRIIFGVR